ncbi:unnamed protein product [Paramecium sonneborni]|uniref:Uncharacterized protein n=1 Tax=Paramecium sonneborni TaxID=65129 RepID=A0A8S1R116_9CILI|nr:unnamed protein product [Paramecium sonneborni]
MDGREQQLINIIRLRFRRDLEQILGFLQFRQIKIFEQLLCLQSNRVEGNHVVLISQQQQLIKNSLQVYGSDQFFVMFEREQKYIYTSSIFRQLKSFRN